MRGLFAALLLACAPAWAQPAPAPVGWPSDICHASGADAENPLCGNCSTSVLYSTPELGTYWGWVCRWPDGQWRTHEITRPWGARLHLPTGAGLAALWAANAVPADADAQARYAQLVAIARPHLASVWRPPEPVAVPPPAWIVAPASTRLRPSYIVTPAGAVVRETAQFIPTGTAVAPTACACDGPSDTAMLGSSRLCRVPNFVTASGVARFAACVQVRP